MAVDTRNKRMSLLGLGLPVPSVLPNPDGAFGAADRAQLLWLYSGIALQTPSVFAAPFTIKPTLQTIQSYLAASGEFDDVLLGEPEAISGDRLTGAIYVAGTTIADVSLGTISTVYNVMVRLYKDMLAEPTRDIEYILARVVQDIASDLLGDFDLGASIRHIDAAGIYGTPMSAVWGYVSVASTMYRSVDMTVPLVVNDTATLGA